MFGQQTLLRPTRTEDPTFACSITREKSLSASPLLDAIGGSRPSLSFEFLPPKDSVGELWDHMRALSRFDPDFVSVTYGAGGTTRDSTVEIAGAVDGEAGLVPVAHLTAVGHSRAELVDVVRRLRDHDVEHLLALRGDPPGDPTAEWVQHPEGLAYAADLVELAKSEGATTVGVAAFPYSHPRSPDEETDAQHFAAKCRAGADYAISQMIFEADGFARMRNRMVAAGGDIPILAGVMPLTTARTMDRSEALSGAPFPAALRKRLEVYLDDPASFRSLGIELTIQLVEDLVADGVAGIHVITFNRSKAASEIVEAVSGLQSAAPVDS